MAGFLRCFQDLREIRGGNGEKAAVDLATSFVTAEDEAAVGLFVPEEENGAAGGVLDRPEGVEIPIDTG